MPKWKKKSVKNIYRTFINIVVNNKINFNYKFMSLYIFKIKSQLKGKVGFNQIKGYHIVNGQSFWETSPLPTPAQPSGGEWRKVFGDRV